MGRRGTGRDGDEPNAGAGGAWARQASLSPPRQVGPRRLPVCGCVRPFPALHALLRALDFGRRVLFPSPPLSHSRGLCLKAVVFITHLFF